MATTNESPAAGTRARATVWLALLCATLVSGASAAPVRTGHVEAELVAASTAFVPGSENLVALKLTLEPGWHTYWRNPGDSGLPTTLEWKLPQGVQAGPIEWLPPRPLPVGPLTNYGYEGVAFHLVTLTSAAGATLGSEVTLAARADWLVCRETCIPEGADLSLTLPVAASASPDPRHGATLERARAGLPRPLDAAWKAAASGEGQNVVLTLVPPAGTSDPGRLRFYPDDPGRIEPSGAQVLARQGDALSLALPVAYLLEPGFMRLTGLVVADKPVFDGRGAATVDLALTGGVVAGPKPAIDVAAAPAVAAGSPATPARAAPDAQGAPSGARGTSMTLALAALFAFLGGAILNLMPCVFPILSIKVLGFAERHDDRGQMRREGLAFAGGVVLTFVALALMLVAARAAGAELGWGFQLQSPAVVTALALLFFALALNLSGVFEFGQVLPAGLRGWSSANRTVDAFGAGILAVVVASPCTAPFMGAALGFALSQSIAATLAIFVALGIGMALPYLLLAWFPAWQRALPRPGAWMLRLKQLLAFPLYATVAWLAWVLGAQLDNDAVLRLALVLVAMGFALWAFGVRKAGAGRGFSIAAVIGAIAAVAVAVPLLVHERVDATAAAPATAEGRWMPWSEAGAREAVAGGRPVFVDFTAAWCVTCQVNKRTTLARADVDRAFDKANVQTLRADWTRRDARIGAALAALGRNGVPVYVLYRPGKEPLLLPEILTPAVVLDALATL